MPDFLAECLTWPENYSFYQALRAAKTWGNKPSEMFLRKAHKLTKYEVLLFNRKLMVAHQILKDETCSMCGTVGWHGRSDNRYIEMEVKTTVCHGCAAKDEKEQSKNPDEKLGHGETRYVAPQFLEESPDGELKYGAHGPGREAWLLEMMAEAEKERRERDLSESVHV